jgi:hypothetical protein
MHDGEMNSAFVEPSVPNDSELLLLKKPLHGKVIKVVKRAQAMVAFGTESGAWKGMELCADVESLSLVAVVEVEMKTRTIRSRIGRRESIVST